MTRVSSGLLAALLLIVPAACAQQPPPPMPPPAAVMTMPPAPSGPQIAQACGADIDRLCAGVPPGQGRIRACMKANMSQLSPGCFDTLMAAASASREAP
jgi:hypothetical protein